ncbi:hypothetical protein NCS56_00975700 [Fusarium sp. Ph1]|nr:hypothetical protein NCS56_00975700 [Fusarium sp. Ph1]
MESSNQLDEGPEAQILEGRVIIRRFTDQLKGADDLERSTKAAQAEMDEEEEAVAQTRLKLLYENSTNSSTSPQEFDVVEIARVELQTMVDKCTEDAAKPSTLERIGLPFKSPKKKVVDVLQSSVQGSFTELKVSVDKLEKKWQENHGPIYNAFKDLCGTFDNHKSVFAIFPSQNDYTSVFCASLTCLVNAANNHSEIAETLSKYTAKISDKVATCSNLILIIKTQEMRKKLANIYARMFRFYRDAIEWYLSSRLARAFQSFNENLKKGFSDAKEELEDDINELYRLAFVGSTAMAAIRNGQVSSLEAETRRQRSLYPRHDTSAGHRMFILLEASWVGREFSKPSLESVKSHLAIEPATPITDATATGLSRVQARAYSPALKPFIIGDEGPGLFGQGNFWLVENDVLPKLRTWMVEDAAPHTLWVSSPYDTTETTSARATALAVIAAAWQAETPVISHFCQRLQREKVREGMTIEQAGLVGLVYSLIHQLLQFSQAEDQLDISGKSLAALNGSNESWPESLNVLRALLDCTPVRMYCVIHGLNDLEWGGGREPCQQLLDVLFTRQQREGTVFNILLTTEGQSRVLPMCIQLKDMLIATKRARHVRRFGTRVEL